MARWFARMRSVALLSPVAVALASGASCAPLDQDFIDDAAEAATKVMLCVFALSKCSQVEPEPELERECHLNEKNQVCCDVRAWLVIEFEIEWAKAKPDMLAEMLRGVDDTGQ